MPKKPGVEENSGVKMVFATLMQVAKPVVEPGECHYADCVITCEAIAPNGDDQVAFLDKCFGCH